MGYRSEATITKDERGLMMDEITIGHKQIGVKFSSFYHCGNVRQPSTVIRKSIEK